MFNVCRRGFAPLSRASRTASTSISTIYRQSILPSNPRILYRAGSSSKSFHSSVIRAYNGLATRDESTDIVPESSSDYITKFQQLADRGLVHRSIINEITKGMKYEKMTDVQSMTINETLKGTDVIAQARTGTGKTLGFLIPVVQNILSKSPELAEGRSRGSYGDRATASDIRAIIMSPTRELAEQLAVEASKLVKGTNLRVQVAVGGNSKRLMLSKMKREGCHLLIATPGRLYDLLNDPYSGVAAPKLSFLVLDEADRLLDVGFADAIDDIVHKLPNRREQDRQTLLFSATVPREVMTLVASTLKPDYKFIQTVQKGEVDTHQKIPQKMVRVNGMENIVPTIVELVQREIAKNRSSEPGMPFKAIVYLNATNQVNLAADILFNLKTPGTGVFGKRPFAPAEIYKIHAKLTQEARTRAAERFRQVKSGILLSTDVTARGMDFPGVTHVIQVGIPHDRDTYIHRLGRTGRGDKQGEGWIIATQAEADAVPRILNKLPIIPDESLETAKVDMTRDAQLPADVAAVLRQVGEATQMVDRQVKTDAYISHLAQHQMGAMKRMLSASAFTRTLNDWTRYGWGWEAPPTVPSSLAKEYGLQQGHAKREGGYDNGRGRGGGGFSNGRGGGGGNGSARGGSSGGYGDRQGGSSFGDRGGRGGYGGGGEVRGQDKYDRGGRGPRGSSSKRY